MLSIFENCVPLYTLYLRNLVLENCPNLNISTLPGLQENKIQCFVCRLLTIYIDQELEVFVALVNRLQRAGILKELIDKKNPSNEVGCMESNKKSPGLANTACAILNMCTDTLLFGLSVGSAECGPCKQVVFIY